MLRPVLDRKLNVLQRGAGGKFDAVVSGKADVRCQYGAQHAGAYLGDMGGSGRAQPTVEFMLIWDAGVEIDENARIQFTQKRVAGVWQPLTNEPLYVLIEGSIAAPEVAGVISHRQARIAKERP